MNRMLRFAVVSMLTLSFQTGQGQWQGPYGYVGADITCLSASDSNLFVGLDRPPGVARFSPHDECSWHAFPFINTYSLLRDGSTVLAGTVSGVYLTENPDVHWYSLGPSDYLVTSLAVSGPNLFAVGEYGGGQHLLRTSDRGANWARADSGLVGIVLGLGTLAATGTDLFVGTEGGVYRSTDDGSSWRPANTGLAAPIWDLLCTNTSLFAATPFGVFVSRTNGGSWGFSRMPSHSLAATGNYVFASGGAGPPAPGIHMSSDDGNTWERVSPASEPPWGGMLAASATTLYSGEWPGVWYRPLSDLVTSAEAPPAGVPSAYFLGQNYPNPFNPTTSIEYSLPRAGAVTLKVFDPLGEEVTTLVSGDHDAGTYNVSWDASGRASGVYFYRLSAGTYVRTGKMMLTK